MKNEQQHHYQDLLQEFREQCLFLKKGDINSRQRLSDEVEQLVNQDPAFQKLFDAMIRENLTFLPNVKLATRVSSEDLLEELRAFAQGKSVDFTDQNLRFLIHLYRNDVEFRKTCDADPVICNVLPYWYAEYHRRMVNDKSFAARSLLANFNWLREGFPVEFDEIELDLLDQLYHSNPEFRKKCDKEDENVREAITSWLEKRKRRASKDKEL